MLYQVNGYKDIFTVLSNERKLGGAIEADFIRLRSGEEFANSVITHMDMAGSIIYSVSFVNEEGRRFIIHVNDISLISQPTHKHIKNLKNGFYRQFKTEEKVKYLTKLCKINEGSYTKPFVQEAVRIVEDIGTEVARKYISLDFMTDKKVVKMARRVS